MNRDRKTGLIIFVFWTVIWFFVIPLQVAGRRESFFPVVVTIFILISSFFLLVISWKVAPNKISHESLGKKEIIHFISIVFMLLIYIVLIDFLGFFIPTFLFLIITMLLLRVRDRKVIILVTFVLLFSIYFIFEKLLKISLPKGRIF